MSLLHLSLRAATRIWEAAVILVLTVYFVLGAGLLTLRYAVLPNAQEFRPWVEQASSQALGLPVHIGKIKTKWHGLMPQFALHDVRIDGPQGQPALQFAEVSAAPSWKSLTRLTLTFEQLVIRGADLTVTRPDASHLEVGGIRFALSGSGKNDAAQQFADWLFSQDEILILDSRLTWVNAARHAPPLPLTQVNLLLRNSLVTHRAALTAEPPAGFGGRIDLRASFTQPLFLRHTADLARWKGTLYGEVTGVDLAALQPQLPLTLPAQTQTGRGSVRAWAQFDQGAPTAFTADLALRDIAVQLAPQQTAEALRPVALLPPIALDTLSTRMTWAPLPGGEKASLQHLQFRTAQGQSLAPVSVDWQWQHPPGQAAQARLQTGSLDLGALAAVAQRLPLPALWQARLTALQPQGRIDRFEAQASWPKGVAPAGMPPAFSVQAQFADLRWNSPAGAGESMPPADPHPLIERGKAAAKALQLPADLPGVGGLSGTLSATQAGGQAQIHLTSLDLPLVYAPARLGFDTLSADLTWKRDRAGQWQVSARRFDFANADAAGSATLTWRSAPRGLGSIDLKGQLTRADARAVWRYLPIDIPLHTRDYLRSAIAAGNARKVDFSVQGRLENFPFDTPAKGGTFEVNAQIENGVFNYAPRGLLPPGQTASAESVHANAEWPEFTQISGDLRVTSHSLEVRNASARAFGARISGVNGSLPSFHDGVLSISGKAQAPATDALRYLVESPINRRLGGVFDGVQAQGPVALDIALALPLDHLDDTTLKGLATLQGVDVTWSRDLPQFNKVRGTVAFDHQGFDLALNAPNVLGGPVTLRGGQKTGEPLQLQASGSFSSTGLRGARADWMQTLGKVLRGQAPYTLTIVQPRGAPEATLELRSNLVGAAIDLPPPLGKPASAPESLLYTRTPLPQTAGSAGRRQVVQIDLGGLARARYVLEEPQAAATPGASADFRVISGGLAIGPQAALPQPTQSVQANVKLPVLDVDAWDAALKPLLDSGNSAAPSPPLFAASADGRGLAGLLPTTAALDIGRLTLMGRVIEQVVVGGHRSGDLLQANVNSRQLSGYIGWQMGQGNSPGTLSARLARLELPKSSDSDVEHLLNQQPSSIPALDIVADDVDLHGHRFSHLEVQAVNRGRVDGSKQWQLTHFELATPDNVLTGSGTWSTVGSQLTEPGSAEAASPARRTSMQFKLAIGDAGNLLATLGKPGLLKGGKGEITGNLAWLGSPLNLDFPSMNGQFKLQLGSGQFLKADPGIAKLLGVLSLQSLPRRFTLDFRDLFASGFAFDKVDADVAVDSGIASTRDFRMSGVSATVRIEGQTNLATETQNLRVVVVPNINAGAASLAYALVNPVVGLGTFLAQYIAREPLARAFTHVYDITGTWVTPIVSEVSLDSPKPAAP
ncbi:MAG: YhdP family protein [Pseudomonadota bacterium]